MERSEEIDPQEGAEKLRKHLEDIEKHGKFIPLDQAKKELGL